MYTPYRPGTYVDFATDDNGLWAVFALSLNNHTVGALWYCIHVYTYTRLRPRLHYDHVAR